ncbi:flagellar M-ring protein FliF [Roseovarius lutimaris]|uniref:Flagellar M-ring protein n=1 Tax=Roseovarius lutimaris TaxID=1005928 RepID=A0A1I5EUI0_9RHOB|nr:flagellar basal-body MS-ring/collar protein FliF [Roseovarius lutimaris]SFO15089.1 flagellar M-ring protein FliF [Roseovarius lutimaris]
MQQIVQLWQSLDNRRRIIVVGATAAMFWTVLALARMASEPSMTLLYAGLESSAAGEVVAALEQRGATYEVRGGAIFVDSARRDELRMTLAGEGLPSSSSKGYELLDGLSGFGTTSQMFDAAYWRAKEGELARTIVSHPGISNARVHISSTGSNPFQRDIRQSASVSITTSGGGITPKHARALQFLVASAVTGLTPEEVSIIDADGGLIGATEEAPSNTADDRAEALRQRAERLLEARVGHGNAVVVVSVDTVTKTESIRERRFDPEGRVAISTDSEERSNTSSDEGGGDVTVASNLPDGDGAQGGASSSENSETRERVNYEVSGTEREITQGPGAIKRLSVAVLINEITATDDVGVTTFVPRSDEELAALRELVSSAVGYDEERGDVITLKTMQFEPLEPGGTAAKAGLLDRLVIDAMSLIQALVLAVVALVLGLFVVRPILARPVGQAPAQIAAAPSSAPAEGASADLTPLTGEIDDGEFDEAALSLVSDRGRGTAEAGDLAALDRSSEDPVARLRNLIGQRQDETVEILRNWLEGEEENA